MFSTRLRGKWGVLNIRHPKTLCVRPKTYFGLPISPVSRYSGINIEVKGVHILVFWCPIMDDVGVLNPTSTVGGGI